MAMLLSPQCQFRWTFIEILGVYSETSLCNTYQQVAKGFGLTGDGAFGRGPNFLSAKVEPE